MQADLASDSQKGDRSTVERFGRVDILVINAAVFPPSMFVEVSAETWDHTVDAGRKGAWLLARFAAKPDQLESLRAAPVGAQRVATLNCQIQSQAARLGYSRLQT